MSAHPVDNFAVAKVTNTVDPNESPYQLHPTTTDFVIQLFSAAAWKGQARDSVQMPLPAYFGEIYMKRSQTDLQLTTFFQRDRHSQRSRSWRWFCYRWW